MHYLIDKHSRNRVKVNSGQEVTLFRKLEKEYYDLMPGILGNWLGDKSLYKRLFLSAHVAFSALSISLCGLSGASVTVFATDFPF